MKFLSKIKTEAATYPPPHSPKFCEIAAMKVQEFLNLVKGRRIMVLGDLMIDRYLWGRIDRISPEAPVPIVEVFQEENRLGGAANVALNLQALGAKVSLGGLVGEDQMGQLLIALTGEYGFEQELIMRDPFRPTTVKTRIIAQQQQVLRVDREERKEMIGEYQEAFLAIYYTQLEQCDAIILQDYDKGFLSRNLIRKIIRRANQLRIPVLVDPKFQHFLDFAGCTLFKPNLRELMHGLNVRLNDDTLSDVRKAILRLREKMPHRYSLVTMGAKGMLVLEKEGWQYLPAKERRIADVSGAGDTVIAVLGMGLAAGIDMLPTAQIANLAGGLVCEEVGVVPIRPERLVKEQEIN